jgi:hypothetical protein
MKVNTLAPAFYRLSPAGVSYQTDPGRHDKGSCRLQSFPHTLEEPRPDIPILKQAKAERAKLQQSTDTIR